MGTKISTAHVAYDGMDVELDFQITPGNCYFQDQFWAAMIFIGLKINDFVPLMFGSKNHEMDHLTNARKAFGLNFLWGLNLAPHMLHMMAWMLNSIFESPLVTVMFKKTLTLVSASFWDTPKTRVLGYFKFA